MQVLICASAHTDCDFPIVYFIDKRRTRIQIIARDHCHKITFQGQIYMM